MALNVLIVLMIVTGIVGGLVDFITPPTTGEPAKKAFHSILYGIAATLLVPLFLEFLQSRILNDVEPGWTTRTTLVRREQTITQTQTAANTSTLQDTAGRKAPANTTVAVKENAPDSSVWKDYLIYAGYCLIAAVGGLRFIRQVSDNITRRVTELEKQTSEVGKTATQAEQKADSAQQTASQAQEQAQDAKATADSAAQISTNVVMPDFVEPVSRAAQTRSAPRTLSNPDPHDPNKGQFGGKATQAGRRLTARVEQLKPKVYLVILEVSALPGAEPLVQPVTFFLHPTFIPAQVRVTPKSGVARLQLRAWGAFTVGAEIAQEATLLELDLSGAAGGDNFDPKLLAGAERAEA